jgi:hypothetical protein
MDNKTSLRIALIVFIAIGLYTLISSALLVYGSIIGTSFILFHPLVGGLGEITPLSIHLDFIYILCTYVFIVTMGYYKLWRK